MTDDAKSNIVASLVVRATDEEVKYVLRLYDPNTGTTALKKKLNVAEKNKLVKTMTYLGVPGQTAYNKTTVVHNLICRVQNLFPDTCTVCQEEYTIDKDDESILECAMCGQNAHTPCILKLLGLDPTHNLTPEEARVKINPFGIPGLHFFCKECSDSTVPSLEHGKLNRPRRALASVQDDGTDLDPSQQPSQQPRESSVDEEQTVLKEPPVPPPTHNSPRQNHIHPIPRPPIEI